MAGGLSYTAEQSTSLSTAEIYGQALVELAEEIGRASCRERV